MAEYYAVQRSSEYLMHYGIKGMRWGVRRAKERNNRQALQKHWNKANTKLSILKDKANRKLQKENAKTNLVAGPALMGLGAAGGLASYGIVRGQYATKSPLVLYPTGLMGSSALTAGLGAGVTGSGIASAIRATKRGNLRAKEKYDRFQKEMNQAFKGVKGLKKPKINKGILNSINEDARDATKAAALSTVMGGPAASMYVSSQKAVRTSSKKSKKR